MPQINGLYRAEVIPPQEFLGLAHDMRDLVDDELHQTRGITSIFAWPYPEVAASSYYAELTAAIGDQHYDTRYAQKGPEGQPLGRSITAAEVTRNAMARVMNDHREQHGIEGQYLLTMTRQNWEAKAF